MSRLSLVFASFIALGTAVLATGCDPFAQRAADVEHPQRFGEGDLTFDYPGNWKIESERETIEQFTMANHTIEPKWGNSLVVVQVFTPGVPVEYDQLLTDFKTGMRESFAGALIQDRQIDGQDNIEVHHDLLGANRDGRRMKFAIEILGETTENTVDIYVAELGDRTIIVYTQAPDEDLPQAKPGFEQIMKTLAVSG